MRSSNESLRARKRDHSDIVALQNIMQQFRAKDVF